MNRRGRTPLLAGGTGPKSPAGASSRPRSGPQGPAQHTLFAAQKAAPSKDGTVTLEGEVVRVTYENDQTGFRVVKVAIDGHEAPLPWVGRFQPVAPGTRVRATGRYERDGRHGDQLRVETLLEIAPQTLQGLEKYLGSGMVHGVGPVFAKRIVEAFGEDALRVLDEEPERLGEVPGLGARRAEAVAKAWASQRVIRDIMIFLQQHGVSPALATRIYKRFGASAIEIVKRAPYRLALDVWGVGFKTADQIARAIGVSPDAPERAQAGVLQMLSDLAGKGHVYAERNALVSATALMLEREEEGVDRAIDVLALSGRVRVETFPSGEVAVYESSLYEAEARLADRLLALLRATGRPLSGRRGESPDAVAKAAIESFEARTRVALAPAQRDAIEQAARSKVLVITGGPGVGKTTIVRAILSLFDLAGHTVRLSAPTGRAAKRMSEATGREAVTLHRMLEFDPKERGFLRKKSRPIEADVIIVDEASMIDLPLCDALTQAASDGARLVLVGDVDQLPSVGPGAVLRDVIASGAIPTVRLSQIFRQAEGSLIVQNAHRIHDGEKPEGATDKRGEFFVFQRSTPEEAAATIHELVTERIPRGFGLHAVRDVQVLSPMNKGPVGTIALNEVLQRSLNPDGPSVTRGGKLFRLGDKVMQLKNDYDREVYNGDVGLIRAIDAEQGTLTVTFDGRDVTYEESDLDELVLAYATSIHKSQGSEYPAVVITLLSQHFVMLSRNLLYTAVTRGKRLVVLVTDGRALSLALSETRREERQTGLAHRLRRG
ncbi:ATP-dependent RecD-like DNA helicase [Polyangium sp. y55x31]|uniref:SF1B family DNA helicase RecD2 n=1 Tax=Polyangium sp. y55x31 TaxID=3042688 RepID=UPI002482B63B|nr:ATP-dependent RecD-like DNA helicase [Polyangium sp. y55x31]MDI1482623.1 ATP-dependent RecD-like DNA helicase [Polyangium sp. y55x31]